MTGADWRALVPARSEYGDGAARPRPLALGIEVQRRVPSRSRWAAEVSEALDPRALMRADPAALVVELAARPLVRSNSSGAWIKGDVSWEALRFADRTIEQSHARWFTELRVLARVTAGGEQGARGLDMPATGEWLMLDRLRSPLAAAHLARAAALGIEIVALRPHTQLEHLPAPRLIVDVAPAPGGLHVEARLGTSDGDGGGGDDHDGADAEARVPLASHQAAALPTAPPRTRPLGAAGAYRLGLAASHEAQPRKAQPRMRVELAILPVGEAVGALLQAPAGVTVPEAEIGEFCALALPSLAREAELRVDPRVRLPEPPPPTLLVRLTLRGLRVGYRLAWRYPGLRGRDVERELDVAAPLAIGWNAGWSAGHDAGAEARLRAAAEAAWAAASDALPFAPAGELAGEDAAELMLHVVPALEALEGVWVERDGSAALHALEGAPHITVTTHDSAVTDWFDLGVVVTVGARTIPFVPLFTALTLGRKRLLLADGGYFSLAHPAFDRLRELIDEVATLEEWQTGPRIHRSQIALWEDFEDLADVAEPAVTWRARTEALRGVSEVPRLAAPAGLRAELRPYQHSGFEWLALLHEQGLGGILADEMGLGKTVQMLALAAHVREGWERGGGGPRHPMLVVAPTSVLPVWRDEAARFSPGLIVHVAGETEQRSGAALQRAAAGADIVITSYAVLRLDERAFAGIPWDAVVLDEAQFVKNRATKAHRAVAGLQRRSTFALTGTPLENTLDDLWALLALTAPGLFPSARGFREHYIGPIERGKVPENQEGAPYRSGRIELLRRRVRPFMLRRTKAQVAAELPPKQEQLIEVTLAPAHRAQYDLVLQRERQKVLGLIDDLDRQRFIVFRSLTLLRMLALAPQLIDPADAALGSAKLDVLEERLRALVAAGRRVLVFSQFTSFLRVARGRVDAAGIATAYLDGTTADRDAAVRAFRSGEAAVFFISLKAGGFGLTLIEADDVFLLDPWWTPAAEAQAIDRAHRIGQQGPVFVWRLVAADTIEQKVRALAERKGRLFDAVLDEGEAFSQALSADDIRALFDER